MKKVLVLLLSVATTAQGEIYTWTDTRGTAHYTNSMYDVPDRYRAKVKVLDFGEKKTESPAPQQGGQVQSAQPAAQAGGSVVRPTAPSQPPAVTSEEPRHRLEGPRPGRRQLRHNGAAGVEK